MDEKCQKTALNRQNLIFLGICQPIHGATEGKTRCVYGFLSDKIPLNIKKASRTKREAFLILYLKLSERFQSAFKQRYPFLHPPLIIDTA